MGKPEGSIGETKLKILAILHNDEAIGTASYGYGVWETMNDKFYSSLGEDGLRNIYHHLRELHSLSLIEKGTVQAAEKAPERHTYRLTNKGRQLRNKYEKYLKPFQKYN